MPESAQIEHVAPAQLLTVNEATAYARISRRTLYNWVHRGWLAYHLTPSNLMRFKPEDLISAPVKRQNRDATVTGS